MARCRQATCHYPSQCWPRSQSSYDVTRPQWVKIFTLELHHNLGALRNPTLHKMQKGIVPLCYTLDKSSVFPAPKIPSGQHILSNPLQWRHDGHDGVSNHQRHDCLFNCLFRRRSKKTSKLRVTGICAGNSPVTGEFPAQRASNAENVSIWWRHHVDGSVQNYSTSSALAWTIEKKTFFTGFQSNY